MTLKDSSSPTKLTIIVENHLYSIETWFLFLKTQLKKIVSNLMKICSFSAKSFLADMRHLGKGQQFHRVGSIDSFFFLPNFYLQSRLQLIHKKMTPYEKYLKYVLCYDLIIKRNLQNPMDLPKIHKVVLNTTTKEFIKDKRSIIPMLSAMEMIVGQKIHPTWTKKSIANFQIRQNQLVGCCVHLRGDNMYNFLYRLINIVLPRIGDEIAQLTMTSTWNTEALSFSLENLLIFPELAPHFSYFSNLQPINITIVFSKLHKNDKSFVLPKKD